MVDTLKFDIGWRSLSRADSVAISVRIEKTKNLFIRFVYLLTLLGASKDNLARGKDQQHHFRCIHSKDEAWEQLGVVAALNFSIDGLLVQGLEFDVEPDVVGAYDVLDRKVSENHSLVANLAQAPRVVLRRIMAINF